ncbi:MAG: hypothetical protein IAG13_21815 [Deltaproteobacteria bacterium]|nr:hypothetical protein [Nannocystaceae bacterium]
MTIEVSRRSASVPGCAGLFVLAASIGCSGDATLGPTDGSSDAASSSSATTEASTGETFTSLDESSTSSADESTSSATTGPTGSCGDYQPDEGEVCDDGNVEDGDGCSADCSAAECFVPVTHATIQEAVDDAACPIVWLAQGTYDANVVITRDVEMVGYATIRAASPGRTVDIASGVSVTLRRLRIMGGLAEQGAGIRSSGTLLLHEVSVYGNDAVGVAPCGGGVWSDGELVLRASQIENNQSRTNGQLARGGGVCMVGGRLELREASLIGSNSALGEDDEIALGGGIHAEAAEILVVEGSALTYNRAWAESARVAVTASGGGIYQVGGSIELDGALIDDNRARVEGAVAEGTELLASGAGFWLDGVTLTAIDSEFRSNNASVTGTGELVTRGGGLYLTGASTASLAGGSFVGNQASAAGETPDVSTSVRGGAVYLAPVVDTVVLEVADATWRDNRVSTYSLIDNDVAMRRGAGGAVYTSADGATARASMHFERCTLVENTASGWQGEGGAFALATTAAGARIELDVDDSTIVSNGASGELDERGGALAAHAVADSDVVVRLRSSTITDNTAAEGSGLWLEPDNGGIAIDLANSALVQNEYGTDCAPAGASITSLGYNAFTEIECALVPGAGDLFTEAPLIDGPTANGGPTDTCALLPASPLRNAGNPLGCIASDATSLQFDQRGEDRHVEGRCDIGAFEYAPP